MKKKELTTKAVWENSYELRMLSGQMLVRTAKKLERETTKLRREMM